MSLSFITSQPTRVFGVIVALLALVAAFGVSLPNTEIEGVVLAVLALLAGHSIQNVEDAKTEAALYTDPLESGAHEAEPSSG